MSDMREWMRWEPTQQRRLLPAFVLDPARIVVGIGAALAIIAGLMPWAQGTIPGRGGFEDVFFSGLGGAGDGVVLILLSCAIAFLVLHHTPALSRVRLVHLASYLLVVFAGFTVINGYRAALLEIEAWERRGGTGEIALGLWLAAAGVAVMAIGLAILLPAIIRWTRHSDDPADLMTISRRGLAEAIAGMVGILVGGWIGIQLAVAMFSVPVMGLIALGAVMGALLGAYAGAWVVGLVADGLARRRPGGEGG
jgi:hypothetical protein